MVEKTGFLHNVSSWLTTTDHKKIGIMYLWLGLFLAIFGGAFARIIRAQPPTPAGPILSPALYNQMLSMHCTLMIFIVIIQSLVGFGIMVVSLQMRVKDMAFPKLNA